MRTSVLFQNTMGASAVAIAATLAISPLLCSMSNGNEQDGDGGAAKEPAEDAGTDAAAKPEAGAQVADADLEDAGERESEQHGGNGHDVVAEDQDAAAVKPESAEHAEPQPDPAIAEVNQQAGKRGTDGEDGPGNENEEE